MMSPDRASVEQHIARLRSILSTALTARGTRSLHLETDPLVGQTSAERLSAPMALPSFDNSQMDGYAVGSRDVRPDAHGSVTLPVSAVVPAGSTAPTLRPGTAAAVMTGAPIPAGADAVVPVERAADGFASLQALQESASAHVRFVDLEPADLAPGRFIRPAGSAVTVGETLVAPNQLLTPGRLGLLAACGISQVPVLDPVETVVIATGAEVRAPGERLSPGQLYDANTVLIRAAMEGFGHRVTTMRISSDDPEDFRGLLADALQRRRPHIVVTAGGVSAGAFEVVREALADDDVEFAPIAQQPGGPQGWGRLPVPQQQAPAAFIGLPGNPVSCAVSLETLVRPALSAVDPGCPAPQRVEVRLAETISSPHGVRQFRRVRLSGQHSGLAVAHPVGGASSHLLGDYAEADALLVLFEADVEVAGGEVRPAVLLQ